MFARTPRLTLRPGWPEDAAALHRAIAHEAVAMKLARLPWPYLPDHAETWLRTAPAPGNHPLLIFAHDLGATPVLVGGIGLHPAEDELEIGYWLTPAAWGRGYATEAGRAVLDMARYALGRERLTAYHHLDNPASGQVLRKLGFRETGRATRHSLARGEDVECLTFELDLVERPVLMAA
ncbi:MAG: family acetyltransferase [Sphingomonas bacterium]|uniref:GNAT family N-acetyltransferase n=1 Tax=Sphingomonas bacterium TaxID=1895847 RepID=UPI00262256C3|nr:GNAT family N-acetyltransferase [Sphingomonas bacterium]MDB5694964.1 family acetyltransferase [Sphingomonas bacterium]